MSTTLAGRPAFRDPDMMRIVAGARVQRQGATPPALAAAVEPARGAAHQLLAAAVVVVAAVALLGAAVKHAQASTPASAVAVAPACAPVAYRIDTAGAPAGGVDAVTAAVNRFRETSGFPLTPVAPGAGAALVISWTPAESFEEFERDARVAGFAEPNPLLQARTRAPIAGTVHLRTGQTLDTGFGPRTWGSLVLHELGHLAGLGHSDDPAALMFPNITKAPPTWTPGEAAEIRAMAARAGCAVPATTP